jgi:hypothetical protein
MRSFHHRPHGLLVAGLTVELLHPDFQRLGLSAMQSRIQTLDQHAGLGGLYFVVMPGVMKLACRYSTAVATSMASSAGGGSPMRSTVSATRISAQPVADRLQLDQRLGHQPELLGHGSDLAAVATGDGRPGLGGGRNALARLHQHRGIETAIARHGSPPPACAPWHRPRTAFSVAGLLAGLACAQKNIRSCSNGRGRLSPLAMLAYCMSTREAMRLT